MRSDREWIYLLEDDERLLKVLSSDEPIPAFPGDPDSPGGRLYRTISVVHLLMQGAHEEAGALFDSLSKSGQNFLCHQLVSFLLQAETESPYFAYLRLDDWMSSVMIHSKRKKYPQVDALDRRLAFRWAPVLRLYLATLLDEWPPEIKEKIERDLNTARQNKISPALLKRLDVMQRLEMARRQNQVDDVFQITLEWIKCCVEHPDYGDGCEFILEVIIMLEFQNHPEGALCFVNQALALLPDQYELLLMKIRVLKQMGDYDQSLQICDRLVLIYPEDYVGYCLRSNIFFLMERYEKAKEDADRACLIAPENPNSLLARAFVHMQLCEYEEALDDFRNILQYEPEAYDALRGEGKCLSMMGQDYKALSCFSRLRKIYPEDPDIEYERADLFFAAGYIKECEKACRRCLQIDPSYANAYVMLGLIAIHREEYDLAHGLLQRAVSLEPHNPFALNELAYFTYLEGDDEKALRLVNRALAETDDYPDAWCNKGLILYYCGTFEEASAAFSRAIDLVPDHITAWIGKGNTLAQLCEFDEAQRCYDKALKLDPHSADACHGKARLYRILGLEDEGRKWQELAYQYDPEIEDL